MTLALGLLLLWLVAVNLLALERIGEDHVRTLGGQRRQPESALLALALVGGTIGFYAGAALYRHRHLSRYFTVRLRRIATAQAILAFILGFVVVVLA